MNLSKIQKLVTDNNGIYIKTKHLGVSHARNTGLRMLNGELICLLDSDDSWLETKLEKQVKYHQENKYLISQTREIWYKNNKKINIIDKLKPTLGEQFVDSLRLCKISSSSVALNIEVFQNLGGYKQELTVCEDYDFWIRATQQYEIGLVDEELVVKHGGAPDQLSKKYKAMDRYRLYSLIYFLNQNFNDLDEDKIISLNEEILNKINILYQGSLKHNIKMSEYYENLLKIFNEDDLCTSVLTRELANILNILD